LLHPAAKKRQLLYVLALFLCLLPWAQLRAGEAPTCAEDLSHLQVERVAAVIDGDTLRLADGAKVRLIGINTPELGHDGAPDQPLADEARDALAALLGESPRVWLLDGVDDRDRYGRRLAWAFDAGGRSLSAQLLARGLGFHVAIAPNHGRADCLGAAERVARLAQLGVWAEPAYRARSVAGLAPGEGGFVLLRDRVTRVSFKENGWWIQLGGKVGVQIRPADRALYSRAEIAALDGRQVQVRGWLVPMPGGWWKLALGHPAMLQGVPSGDT